MLQTRIGDGHGSDNSAKVDNGGALVTAERIPDTPAVGTANRYRYHEAALGSLGADSGVTDMSVDGSVTPQSFYIDADPDFDIIIRRIVIVMVDGSIAYNKFGAINALTNGWSISLTESGVTTNLVNAAKTTGEIIAALGTNNHQDLANFNAANDNAFILDYSVSDAFPPVAASGIRLGRGSRDKITSTVNDDITGLVSLTVNIIGTRHYPIEA